MADAENDFILLVLLLLGQESIRTHCAPDSCLAGMDGQRQRGKLDNREIKFSLEVMASLAATTPKLVDTPAEEDKKPTAADVDGVDDEDADEDEVDGDEAEEGGGEKKKKKKKKVRSDSSYGVLVVYTCCSRPSQARTSDKSAPSCSAAPHLQRALRQSRLIERLLYSYCAVRNCAKTLCSQSIHFPTQTITSIEEKEEEEESIIDHSVQEASCRVPQRLH